MNPHFYLVVRIHFGHHSFFQQVEGQYLQHIKLMCHFCFDWSISSNNMLEKRRTKLRAAPQFGLHQITPVLSDLPVKQYEMKSLINCSAPLKGN